MKEYRTRDLAEATAIIVAGRELQRIDREDSICYFIFTNSKLCTELSNKFFFGELLVNARSYHETMNHLKNKIFKK